MPVVEPYRVEYRVRGYDCGYGGPLKVFALTNFFQEAAGDHAAALGIGMEALAPRGRTWMLSRIDLRMDGTPAPGDRVEVLTWPAGTKGIFALRDLVLRDAVSRAVFARAVYAYLVVDVEARKPLRPDRSFGVELPRGADPHPVPDFDFSIPAPVAVGEAVGGRTREPDLGDKASGSAGEGGGVQSPAFHDAFPMQAASRHIDYNGHVNNAYIVDWLTDAVPRSRRGGIGRVGAMKIEFSAEMLENDRVAARWAAAPGAGTITGLYRGDTVLARAHTSWV